MFDLLWMLVVLVLMIDLGFWFDLLELVVLVGVLCCVVVTLA